MDSKDAQVMIDLETLSKKKTALIISIGAVKFNAHEIIDTFYVNITPASARAIGLSIDRDTIDWWKQQSPEAIEALKVDQQDILVALKSFSAWFGPKSLPTWGNGVSFDNVILENAYFAAGLTPPWRYHHERCFRTVSNLFNIQVPKRDGVLHNALDDAKNQTVLLQKILQGAL